MAEISIESREVVVDKIRTLLEILESQGFDIEAAFLYGSQAAGMPDSASDIDVAIVSSDLSGDRIDDWMRLNSVASRIDVRMEVMGFRPEQFRDENPLAWEVKTKGIKVA